MPKGTRTVAPALVTVATFAFSLLCVSAAIWLIEDSAWLGLALLGMGVVLLSNLEQSRVLVSGLDDDAKGRALVAAASSWQQWVPLSIGFVLFSAAAGTKVAGAAGGFAAAASVAIVSGVLALRWMRRKGRMLADPDPETASFGLGMLVDGIVFACFLVAWTAFTFYALFGLAGAVAAAASSGLVALLMLVSSVRAYRSWRAGTGSH